MAIFELTNFSIYIFLRNEEKLEKLCDFTTDFVLEVTAKLLNEIHGQNEKPFKNVKPPQSMSARYNLASKMAEILANLDYPSQDLGYQTFLYSSENELRKLFEFLIDKLPKEQNADIGEDQDELGMSLS